MKYNEKPARLTFKKLVALIADIETESDWNEACALVDWNYQAEAITWNDHETLYRLIGKVVPRI